LEGVNSYPVTFERGENFESLRISRRTARDKEGSLGRGEGVENMKIWPKGNETGVGKG